MRLARTFGSAFWLAFACAQPRTQVANETRAPVARSDTAVVQHPTSPPKLLRVTPDSARVPRGSVVTVTLSGSGFEPGGGNRVDMGPVHLTMVRASADGTQIMVVIPDEVAGPGEAPPRRLMPGSYPVTVTTTLGVSNALVIRILP